MHKVRCSRPRSPCAFTLALVIGIALLGCSPSTPPASPSPEPPAKQADWTPGPDCTPRRERTFSPDGSLLAVGYFSDFLLYETAGWKLRGPRRLQRQVDAINVFEFSPNGPYVATLTDAFPDYGYALLAVHRTDDLSLVNTWSSMGSSPPMTASREHGASTVRKAFSSDGRWFLVAVVVDVDDPSRGGRIELLRTDNWSRAWSMGVADVPTFYGFGPDSQHFAVAMGGEVRLYPTGDGRVSSWAAAPDDPDFSLEFSHDSRWLTFRARGGAVVVEASGGPARPLKDADCDGRGLRFSEDGKLVAVGGEKLAVCVFDVASGELRAKLRGAEPNDPTATRASVRRPEMFSRDARTLVVVRDDGTPDAAYELPSGRLLELPEHVPLVPAEGNSLIAPRSDGSLAVFHAGVLRAVVEPSAHPLARDTRGSDWDICGLNQKANLFARSRRGKLDAFELVHTDGRASVRVQDDEAPWESTGQRCERSFRFDPNDRFVVTEKPDVVSVWDTATGRRNGPPPTCFPTPKSK